MTDLTLFRNARTEMAAFADEVNGASLLPSHLRGKPADVYLIAMTGHELGMSALQAIRSIHVIEGKPTLSADGMASLVTARSSVCVYLMPVEMTDVVCTYETQRVGHPAPVRYSFSMEDAKRAGLVGKGNWSKFPAAMLRARCVSALCRAVYPDLVAGIYDPDELQPGGAPSGEAHVTQAVDTSRKSTLKTRVATVAPEPDTKALREQMVSVLASMGAAPSDFRDWLKDQPEFAEKVVPPVAEWDAGRLGWAVKALDNGIGQRFARFLEEPAPDAEQGGDDEI